jgi:hypothetical protein
MVFLGRRMPFALFTMILLVMGASLVISKPTREGENDWIPILPEDFESEYPTLITIEGGAVGGTGWVADFIWNQTAGPPAHNMTEDGMKLNFTPSEPGDYTFEMRVMDDKGNESKSVSVNITVVPNHPPIILPHDSSHFINEDDELVVNIGDWVEDEDEELEFSVNWSEPYLQVNPLGFGSFQLIPLDDYVGSLDISFIIEDGFNNSVQLDATIVLQSIPDAPKFKMINGNEVLVGTQAMTAYEDSEMIFNFTIEDPDLSWGGDSLTIVSDQGRIFINGTSGWFIPDQEDVNNGSMIINFQVTDSYGLTDNVSIVLDIMNVNDDPELYVNGMVSTLAISTDLTINFTGTSDIDGDTLTFYFKEGAGNWIQIQGIYILNFDTPGNHTVHFRVDDGNGGSQQVTYVVKVIEMIPSDDDDDDDDIKPPDDDDDDTSKDSVLTDPILVVMLSIIAVLALVFFTLLFLLIKNRKRKEDDIWEKEGWEE